VIVMGDSRAKLETLFASVEWKAHVDHPYSMPYNHIDIYYCRGLRQPLGEFWPNVKNWN
jgi:hypothetical protein